LHRGFEVFLYSGNRMLSHSFQFVLFLSNTYQKERFWFNSRYMKYTLTIVLSLFILINLLAQDKTDKSLNLDPGFLIGLDYGYKLVGGDMKERFGNHLAVGGNVAYVFKNTSFALGIGANYFFGDTVYQDVIAHLRDDNGHLIGINGDYAQVKLRQRGFEVGLFGSQVFSFASLNERSGIRIDLGASLLQHWIRIQDDYNTVAQFDDPYQKGYDRLTGGLAIDEFIGFQYLSDNKRINFYAGLSFSQAWTTSLRDYDFATQSSLDESRFELLSGFKVGWILPIYMESQPDEIYY
jgi:hypothetical protein